MTYRAVSPYPRRRIGGSKVRIVLLCLRALVAHLSHQRTRPSRRGMLHPLSPLCCFHKIRQFLAALSPLSIIERPEQGTWVYKDTSARVFYGQSYLHEADVDLRTHPPARLRLCTLSYNRRFRLLPIFRAVPGGSLKDRESTLWACHQHSERS